uniref:Transcription elongation factor SPT5 n=1 Tax=Soboliphyme baturini TaxID=241478 RepID=A0A183IQK7_9BILA
LQAEYYDDEEEEEEEEERPRKRKGGARDFLLDEVEVESDEEEEAPEEGLENEAQEAEAALASAREIEGRRRREELWKGMNEDEINEYFRKKYGRSTHATEGDEEIFDDISQQGLLPSTTDPNLWLVRCRIGEEKQIALLLMRKFLTYECTEEPLQIKSVIVKEGLKGIIYIEAYKQPHVLHAIEGVSALNANKVQLVPIKEMPDVLRVVKDIPSLKRGMFVRLKRTVFKDDLAQVDFVDLAQNTIHLKLIPRIDYSRMRGALRGTCDFSDRRLQNKGSASVVPPPNSLMSMLSDGDFLIFEGNRYSRRGYLFKPFPMNAIIADGIKPSLTELEKFQEGSEDLKTEFSLESDPLATINVNEKRHSFAAGDNVEVVEGELMNLHGKVLNVDEDKVMMLPDHADLKAITKMDPLTFSAHELKKYFKVGDHVRVLAGHFENDTGLIVHVEENLVILLSDLTMHELKVRPKDVQLCQEVATGVDSLGQYQYGDLIQIDQQTVGVIVRLEREYAQVLNMHGKVVRIRLQAVVDKKDSRYAVALDSDQNNIMIGDMVRIVDGPHVGKQGEIKHLYRSYVFVHSRLGNLTPFMISPLRSPSHSMDGDKKLPAASPRAGGGAGSYSYGRSRVRRDSALIGNSIRITEGPMKAAGGTVSTYDKTPRSDSGRTPFNEFGKTPMYGSQTPMYGSQTPLTEGGRTPYYGSQTPLHDQGSRTPGQSGVWDPNITNTPARQSTVDDDFNYDEGPSSTAYGAPMSVNPSTPGYVAETPLGASEWVIAGVEVTVRQLDSDQSLVGQSGTVRSVTGSLCSVWLPDIGKTISIYASNLDPVKPEQGDKVGDRYLRVWIFTDNIKVIDGDDREVAGELLSIDGLEGVVKTDSGDIKLYNLNHLCKCDP